jgi:predicted nucleotidyltransferase
MLSLVELFKNKTLAEAIQFMEQSESQFYLTGSRYFGGEDERSDWDFFAGYSKELEQELLKARFEVHAAYKTHTDVNVVFKKANIHIQLVGNIEEKKKIQEMIRSTVFMSSLTHPERKMIWHLAYKCYREGKDVKDKLLI